MSVSSFTGYLKEKSSLMIYYIKKNTKIDKRIYRSLKISELISIADNLFYVSVLAFDRPFDKRVSSIHTNEFNISSFQLRRVSAHSFIFRMPE